MTLFMMKSRYLLRPPFHQCFSKCININVFDTWIRKRKLQGIYELHGSYLQFRGDKILKGNTTKQIIYI